MTRASRAGALYALVVFLIGFILGTIRVLLIVPRLGETAAVLLEAPLILAASWFVCRWCVNRLQVPPVFVGSIPDGSGRVRGAEAAEFALGRLAFDRSITGQLGTYGSAAGEIGLAAQIVFATFPLVQIWRR